MTFTITRRLRAAAALAPLAALVACNAEPEPEPQYEADVEVPSGSELIVTEQDPAAVDVEVPDSPMTPVPEGTASDAETAAEPAPPPASATPGM